MPNEHKQLPLFNDEASNVDASRDSSRGPAVVPDRKFVVPKLGKTIPLELARVSASDLPSEHDDDLVLPSRWEEVRAVAEHRHVFSTIVDKLRDVETALGQLGRLIELSKISGYVWVVYGKSGSGKSAFFHTLEQRLQKSVKTSIQLGDRLPLGDYKELSHLLESIIRDHKSKFGNIPLLIVLEQREQSMTAEERAAISQALRNTLRPPGPGSNVIFVLPVINLSHGQLFLSAVSETGVATLKEGIYTFDGPASYTHPDILSDLFYILKDKNIEDYFSKNELRDFSSTNQTIGEYIRTINAEIVSRRDKYANLIKSHRYRPRTVIITFIVPQSAWEIQRILRGMSDARTGRIKVSELFSVTDSKSAKKWEKRKHLLAEILNTLDMRIVEFDPSILYKLFFAHGWDKGGETGRKKLDSAVDLLRRRLEEKQIPFREPSSVKQNVRSQLAASNLFHIIAGKEIRRLQNRNSDTAEAEKAAVELACNQASNYYSELHLMVQRAIEDVLTYPSTINPEIPNWKEVYAEASVTYLDERGVEQKRLRPDVVVETHDHLYLIEFHWRNKDLSEADVASYILQKIDDYSYLPIIRPIFEA